MGFDQEALLHQRLRVLVYTSGVDVSSSTFRFLADRPGGGERRRVLGTRWRRLSVGRQTPLTPVHLRGGQTYAQLAAGLGSARQTVYRGRRRGCRTPAFLGTTVAEAARVAPGKAFVLDDATPRRSTASP